MKIPAFFLLAFLLTSNTALAATTYNRTPGGNVISDSFTITVTVDDVEEICPSFMGGTFDGWNFTILRSGDTSTYVTGLHSPLTTGLNSSYTFTSAEQRDIVYVAQNCSFDGNVMYAMGVLEGISINTTIFTINPAIVTPPASNIYGAGGLMGTSTNLLAAVAGGVTSTGTNIWPLFVLVGVALAFVIAIKVQSFIMAAGAKERGKVEKEQHYARTGDYKAFKRGRKNFPGLWKD